MAFCTPIPYVPGPNGSPVLDTISVRWHRKRTALQVPTNFNLVEVYCDGLPVAEARNLSVEKCLAHQNRPEFIFFLDYDVLPEFDALRKLLFRAASFPDYDIYAGVYCCKQEGGSEPLIYTDFGRGPFWNWTIGDILTTEKHGICALHMGLTLIRLSTFDRIPHTTEDPWFKSPHSAKQVDGYLKTERGSEDIYFCKKGQDHGLKILVDTSVLAGHEDKRSGIIYGLPPNSPPVERCFWLTGENGRKEKPKKIALDIGAGNTRRRWGGYKTYTTDIRSDTNPDYVMDSRMLNLPDEHFDLVASSHHLEHIGRWEQESVWSEMFRILKPGGTMEHIVPTVEWASRKIIDGDYDEHALNVMYGAQEAHGYDRQFNTHYFGYTKVVAKALAEGCGLVDVKVTDWRDEESLGYNLIITGRRPVPGEEKKTSRKSRKGATNGKSKRILRASKFSKRNGAAKKPLTDSNNGRSNGRAKVRRPVQKVSRRR